jgi:hypothetical protein
MEIAAEMWSYFGVLCVGNYKTDDIGKVDFIFNNFQLM